MRSTFATFILVASLFVSFRTIAVEPAIRLYNPTEFNGPALVEIPTGRLASPGLIDWSTCHLELDGKVVPSTIREGRAHWQSTLTAPVATPRSEDLLVFWCPVPPGVWREVQVVKGAIDSTSSLVQDNDTIIIRYPEVEVSIDAASGMMTGMTSGGESLLEASMSAAFSTLASDPFQYTGSIGAGYGPFQVNVKTADTHPSTARLISKSSTAAMTELNFVLQSTGAPEMALTYRIHCGGLVEIVADERPWTGPSPWMNHAFNISLPLKGNAQSIPLLENRQAFYGFKDFSGTIPQLAQRYEGTAVEANILGEAIVNGRHWLRRIQAVPRGGADSSDELLEMMDEGLVVEPRPLACDGVGSSIEVVGPPETQPMRDNIIHALSSIGIQAGATQSAENAYSISLELADGATKNIDDDGYEIREPSSHHVLVSATALLGLNQAATTIAKSLLQEKRIPLIARNPVVAVRGGGFGGGNFEVDFPYGDDAEWEHVFEGLLDSGMNTFWCLGMWGNWKLPVSYKYMPELHSDDPEAYDESSGVLFRELDQHREHGLKLMHYLQQRGGRVYVWLPIGCVPTTFVQKHPEALKPGSVEEFWGRPKGTPCFTHPVYDTYLDAFLKELVETYPLDGVVLVRDDNGGVCDCERCKAFTASSKTKNAVWEQYLQIYGKLRALGFKGAVGVYPYFDGYTPALDAEMPEDLFIAGHGASTAALTRDQSRIGHMPDTWIDNLYTNFKLPPSPRMRRLLGDRGSFYIGGAYQTTELPWESMGYFGWEPTATPNTFRYQWGARELGKDNALKFVRMSDVYEDLWEINDRYFIPNAWTALDAAERARIADETRGLLRDYDALLSELRQTVSADHKTWIDMAAVFTPFLEYHLRRLELFMDMIEITKANRPAIDSGTLPAEARAALLAKYGEMKSMATNYAAAQNKIPGSMMEATRSLTMPYNEWMTGFEGWLDPQLERAQFAAKLVAPAAAPVTGQSFTIAIEIQNTGMIPWDRCELALSGNATALGLKIEPVTDDQPIAPGDRATRTISGTTPSESVDVTVIVFSPTRNRMKIAEKPIHVTLE